MKNLATSLMCLAASVAGAGSLHALPVPWQEAFDTPEAFGQFSVINANNDGNEWEYSNNNKCAWISYHSDLAMDDWLVTPAFSLERGAVYKFQLDAKNSFGAERFEVFAGNAAAVEAMTISVIEPVTVNKSSFTTFSGEFSVPESGEWYIGIHGCSDPDRMYLYVDNLQLTRGVSEASPAGVSDFKVVPASDGTARVDISGVLPSKTVSGAGLEAVDKLEVWCDNDCIATLTGLKPGSQLDWTHEDAPLGRHTYMVVAFAGTERGEEAAAEVFVGPNVPGKIPYLAVGEFNPGEVTVKWRCPETDVDGNPLNPALVTYKVVRYEVMEGSLFYEEDIEGADALTGTEFVHRAIDDGKGQIFTAYGVYAITSAGESPAAKTTLFPVGTSYETPYKESFGGGSANWIYRSETIRNYQVVPSWEVCHEADGDIRPRDNDYGYIAMMGEHEDDCARYYSGKINLEGLERPALSFYVYNFSNGNNADDLNQFEVYVSDGRQFVLAKEFVVKDLAATGWNLVVVPLADYAGQTIQFAFQGTVKNYMATPVDCIAVGELYDTDLDAVSVSVPDKVTAGRAFEVGVRIENAGAINAEDYTVELYRDGELAGSVAGPAIAPASIGEVSFTEMLDVIDVADVVYHAVVIAEGDAVTANNFTPKVEVEVAMPKHPVPAALTGSYEAGVVKLTWEAPDFNSAEPEPLTDDFEAYAPFATAGAGGWLFTDADGQQVGKLDITMPGITFEGSVQSFWVMDADCEGANSLYAAHSGKKYLAQIFNNDNSACDDWAISPELYDGGQTVSFYAKSYSSYPAFAETFEFRYSESGTDIADFKHEIATVEAVPNAWTKYEYELPEGARHFAIRCISAGCYMLFVDDVTYTPAGGSVPLELKGYHVYRDGKRLTGTPLTDCSFEDMDAPSGAHSYVVTALYDKGESLPSNGFSTTVSSVDASGISASVTVRGLHGSVVVEGADGLNITLFTPDGKAVSSIRASASERISVAPGIYLVKVGNAVFKVSVQ